MAYNTYIPIVTDGLVFSIDAYNQKSYINGDTIVYNLKDNQPDSGNLLNGVGFDTNNWSFDGVNDRIDFSSVDGVNNFTNTDNYTVSIWVNISNTLNIVQEIIAKFGGGGTGYPFLFRWRGNVNPKDMTITCWNGTTANSLFIQMPTEEWLNVAATYDWSNSKLTVYVNGEYKDDRVLDLTGSISNTGDMAIGARNTGTAYFKGNVSNANIYNRALSSSEVKQNYDATKWRFL